MKMTSTLKLLAAASLTLGAMTPAYADFSDDARKVFTTQQSSILSIKGIMKVEVSMNGQVAKSQEAPIISQGVSIGHNLILASYRTVMPAVGTNAGQQPGLSIDTNLQELKVVDSSGEEFDAKLVLHDEDLDLAFLAIDPKGDNAADFKAPAVDISKDIELNHLDEVVYLNRFNETLRYVAGVSTDKVTAVIEKPRKSFICSNARPGNPVFNAQGEFVGLTVVKKASDRQATPIILPAKYVRKLVAQAEEKSAALSKES